MEKYALLLTQNTDTTGSVTFDEKLVVLTERSVLVGSDAAGGNPKDLTAATGVGDLGKVLKLVPNERGTPGVKWAIEPLELDGHYVKSNDDFVLNAVPTWTAADGLSDGLGVQDVVRGTADATDTDLATEKAVRDAINASFGANDAMVYKGVINASTNPPYPVGDAGHTYKISHAGKLGGASGPVVEKGDMVICTLDDSTEGTHAAVGANWNIIQFNIDATDLVLESAFTPEHTILQATVAGAPLPLVIGENTVLGRVAGNVVAAQLVNDQVATNTLALDKLVQLDAPSTLLGANAVAGAKDVGVITLGIGLEMSDGGVLTATNTTDGTVTGITGTAPVQVDVTEPAIPNVYLETATSISTGVQLDTHMQWVNNQSIIGNDTVTVGTSVPKTLAYNEANEVLWRRIGIDKLGAAVVAPATPTTEGHVGEMRYDDNFVYRCVSAGNWRRFPMSKWD